MWFKKFICKFCLCFVAVSTNGRKAEFQLLQLTRSNNLKRAMLNFPVKSNQQLQHYSRQQRATSDQRVKLYLKAYGPQNQTVSRRLIHEEECNTDSETETVKIDVTSLLKAYGIPEDGSNDDHSVVLEADFETVTDVLISTNTSRTRLTVVSKMVEEGDRNKRQVDSTSAEYCLAIPHERRCCLKSLPVDFRHIGWKWVISPSVANIYYCAGACPYAWHDDPERHRPQLLRAYRKLNPTSAPEPCCSAARMRGLAVVIKKYADKPAEPVTIPHMVVESCICD